MPPEQYKKLSEAIKSELASQLSNDDFKNFITKTKDASGEDTGTFEVIISTADCDRQGEIIDQNGWDLTNYKNNPVVLWGHDYWSLPIGICDSIEMVNGKLVAKGRFAPAEANPFAQQVRKLYDLKIVRTTSVGFIPSEQTGNTITRAELLEFSFVPVPANPYALSLRQVKELGINTEMLSMKGIAIKEVEEEPKVEGDEPKEDETVEKPEEVEQKGAIADELNADEIIEQKWDYCDEVYEIISAFYSVYLDEATPVDQFSTLLTEAANLLLQLAQNPEAESTETEGKIAKAKGLGDLVKMLEARNQKAGRVLSEKNRTTIKDTIDSLETTTAALQELYNATEQGDGTEEGSSDASGSKQRSIRSGSDKKAFSNWMLSKQVLVSINNATSEALRKFNEGSRK
jgi:HK97 family phage prohead protease